MSPSKRHMITLSVRGDDAYRAAIRELARRRGLMVGDLVRQALDQSLGTELDSLMAFFVTHHGSTNEKMGKVGKQKTNPKDTSK